MSSEIERKFVLPGPPEWLEGLPSEPIEQGYLAADDDSEVRLRRIGGATRLTVKRGRGLSRKEREVDLAPEQFDALWPLTAERRVTKRRHRREIDEGTVEVDVYSGPHDGLVVAEIEFDSVSASERFRPPSWLGAEVTGDDRWSNRALADAAAVPPPPG